MKKIRLFAMAILLVPWLGCNDQTALKSPPPSDSASDPKASTASTAEMVLPPVKDTLLPSGRKNIYLIGRRNMQGFYVERSVFPAGYKGMPHVHNGDIYFTVISGTCYIVLGNKFDTTVKSKPLGPGSFMVVKAEQPHYEWFPEECVLQVEGMGPNETYYVNETPSKK